MDPHHLAALVKDCAMLLHKRFDAEARHLGFSRAQWHVLWALSRTPGCNQAELAEQLDVESISICRMVDRLTEAGFVERRRDLADRRAWRLHMTEAGLRLSERARAIGSKVIAEAMDGFDADTASSLCAGLERFRDNLSSRRRAASAS